MYSAAIFRIVQCVVRPHRLLCRYQTSGPPTSSTIHQATFLSSPPLVNPQSNNLPTETPTTRRVPHFSGELYQALFYLKPDSPPNSRALRIALLGCPNSGKSSLVNMLCHWRVCATSLKVNTTRAKQTAILTHDDAQLIFVDLPGVLARQKRLNNKLEKALIRDPHAGIFDADLILVVVDIDHKYSRYELDKEVLRALYYFHDKPSILVLNKIDRLPKRRGALLDIARRLSDGIVGGRTSHVDKYANRFHQRVPTLAQLQSDPKLQRLEARHTATIGGNLSRLQKPLSLVEKAERLSNGEVLLLDDGRCLVSWPSPHAIRLNETSQWIEADSRALLVPATSKHLSGNKPPQLPAPSEVQTTAKSSTTIHEGREIPAQLGTDIAEYFKDNVIHTPNTTKDNMPQVPQTASSDAYVPEDSKLAYEELVWRYLEETMLLKSVSKEVVRQRREKWHEVHDLIRGQISWPRFQEIFMCSAATGEGVDGLRNHLLSLARPAPWTFHSSVVTETEPQEIVRMCIWAHCLNILPKETPYQLTVTVEDYDKSPDETLFIRAVLQCSSERNLQRVIGSHGDVIKEICQAAKDELKMAFQTEVVLKLEAVQAAVPGRRLKKIREAGDFAKIFPNFGK